MDGPSADPSSTDLETGVHNSWRLSPWSKKLHGAGLFIADEEEGQIEIPEAGLYLVYAQVKMAQINFGSRNQLHNTANTCQHFNFGWSWPG